MIRLLVTSFSLLLPLAALAASPPAEVKSAKITILSTMLADYGNLGEWGFSALVEADGHRILFDTGAHQDVVLKNLRTLKLDLADVPVVILSHNHHDHTGGLITLRQSVLPDHPAALAIAHVGTGIFYSRKDAIPGVEGNTMVQTKLDYEKTGGRFVVHDRPFELYPGVWLTGPIPRVHPERNWSGDDRVVTPSGVVEDNIPEDMSLILVTSRGEIILTGCGHAGVVNIAEYTQKFLPPMRIHALIGGVHLYAASEETLKWTASRLRPIGIDNFIGAHCTGIETVFQLRPLLGLDRAHAVVGAVGATFTLGSGIDPGEIAR